MKDSLPTTATLLVLTSREDEAERILTSLRNGGLPVRTIFTNQPERMEDLAAATPFELILCCENDAAIDLDNCLSQYRRQKIEAPFVIIANEATESATLMKALRQGARDITWNPDTEHIQHMVARELSDYRHRRNEKQLRERLEECEKRSRELVAATGEGVSYIQEGIHVQVNPVYQELFGYSAVDDLEGFPLLDLIASEYHSQVGGGLRMQEQGEASGPTELYVQCVRADGEHFDARLNISQSKLEGEPCVRVIVQAMISDEVQTIPESQDQETGLPNRSALIDELELRLADPDRAGKSFSLVYVGIRFFTTLLRNRGLSGGLEAAARFGESLRELTPEGAFLARLGDDAFVMLVDGLRPEGASALAARIEHKARLPLALGEEGKGQDTPRCGTGLMYVDSIARPAGDLLDNVYRDYLFSVLDTGAPTETVAVSEVVELAGKETDLLEEERKLAERIQNALAVDDFQLVYQPIVSLKGDSQESYNVLIRLREKDRSLREAKDFLPVAIKSGHMVAIDRWVIRNSIAELANQHAKGQKINFFVNVAEQTLMEDELLIWICDNLRELEARGNWLTIQVIEEHARRHASVFARLTDGLRKVSCKVAVNRFGEGPNPEILLQNLHLDYVKFTPDLGKGLADDKGKQRRLQELTKLCRDAGVKSVVTGVEDARSLTVLWTAGIDYVQGNFLQKPSTAIGQARQA